MRVLLGNRATAALAAATLSIALATAAPASAASPIGPDGQIHGCYVAKGTKKGSIRLLAAGKKCKKRKKEKPIAWSVQGPQGTPGATGAQGTSGPAGESGISTEALQSLIERINQQDATIASLQTTVTGLTTTVSGLLTQVGALQGVLNGLTNSDLTGVVSKLNGITNADLTGVLATLGGLTNTELNGAVDSVADVNALCTRVGELATFGNDLRTAVSGIALAGTIPPALTLTIPVMPAALGAFACP